MYVYGALKGFEICRFCGRPLVIKCPRVVDVVFWSSNSDSAYPITLESMQISFDFGGLSYFHRSRFHRPCEFLQIALEAWAL